MADRIDGTRSVEDSCCGDGDLTAPGWNLVPAVERGMGINKKSKGRFWRVAHILVIDEERGLKTAESDT